jgi:hypothetical protein
MKGFSASASRFGFFAGPAQPFLAHSGKKFWTTGCLYETQTLSTLFATIVGLLVYRLPSIAPCNASDGSISDHVWSLEEIISLIE